MGLKCAPDFAQQVTEEVLRNVNDTGVYLDGINAFSGTWNHHILLLDKIIHWQEANGFTSNPLKWKWAIQETNWLRYWLTPTGLKLWHKKMMVSCKCKDLKNFCRCMVSLVPSSTTNECGHNVHTPLHPFPASPERRNFVGHLKWILPSNAWKH